jgi:hypothetical protein
MTSWLERRTVWQYALILWIGSVLCELLAFAILDSLGRWRPRSGVNDGGLAPSRGMLGDGCGSFFGLCGWVAGPADRGRRVEELTAQVVQ